MFKETEIREIKLVQHCDQCDISYLNAVDIHAWCGMSGTFGLEGHKNLHFHFCTKQCMVYFQRTHEKMI